MNKRHSPANDFEIERRKEEHLRAAASVDTSADGDGAGWDDVELIHNALPEVDRDAIDLRVAFLGHTLSAPLLIAGMTGGHRLASKINARLARVAESYGLAMGVGSQRAALWHPNLRASFSIVRREAPTAFLIGNIGAPQLIDQATGPALTSDQVAGAVEMIQANALAIHLNFLQEVVQPEGDRRAAGCLLAIAELCRTLPVPVIAKETGAGLARATAAALARAGAAAIDVGGRGGTSFVHIERRRAEAAGAQVHVQLGHMLRHWGIRTPAAIVEAVATGLPVIATGGVRTGLDAARALALGATLVGVGQPLAAAAMEGEEPVRRWIDQFLLELRTVAFLTGAATMRDLAGADLLITGATRDWLAARGHDVARYARERR